MSSQKFIKDVGIVSLTNLVIALKGLIILPIITKILGTENYGVWVQIIVTISLTTTIATLGLPYTLVRFLAAEKDKKEIRKGIYSVLGVVSIVALFVVLILFIFSTPISNFFGEEEILVKVLALVIFFECLNLVFLNIFRAFQEISRYSFFMNFQTIGEICLIATAVFLGFGLLGAVLSLLFIRILIFLIICRLILKRIGVKIPELSEIRIKKYLNFGIPTIPSSISSWIVHSSDRYLINYFLGTIFVGYYGPAYTLGTIINLFVAPLSFVLPAFLSKFYDKNQIEKVKKYLRFSLKYFLMISIPSFFGLSVLSKQLLTIFSTPEIANHGYSILPLIALSIILWGIYTIFIQIIILVKKTKIIAKLWLGAAFLNLLLNCLLIPKMGILGAAIATLVAYILICTLTWYFSFQVFRFHIDGESLLKSIFASFLMGLFILWFNPIGTIETLIAIILGIFIYGILIFLINILFKKN